MADRPPDLETELRDTLQAPGGRRIRSDELWADVQHRIRRHRRRRRLVTGFAAVAVLALAAGATTLLVRDDDPASTVDTGPGESLATTTTADAPAATTTSEATPDAVPSDLNPGWTALEPGPITDRDGHSVTWTGTELIVWGGFFDDGNALINDGAAYNPTTGTWRSFAPRYESPGDPVIGPWAHHVAVWTGNALLLWGGQTSSAGQSLAYAVDGAAYDPQTNAWRPIPAAPLPADRYDGVWTGTELVVVGGGEATVHAAAYDPSTGRWRELPEPPLALASYQLEWSGNEVLAIGGERVGSGPVAQFVPRLDALAFDPETDVWRQVAGQNVSGSASYDARWTETGLVVWTYQPEDGTLIVDPESGSITQRNGFNYECEDTPRASATADGLFGTLCGAYGRFDTSSGEWTETPPPRGPGRAGGVWDQFSGHVVAAGDVALLYSAAGTGELFAYELSS